MDKTDIPPEFQEAIEYVIEQRGFWPESFDELLYLQPKYPTRYAELSAHPGKELDEKLKELIHLAIDSSVTHLYYQGVRGHTRFALDKNVSLDELLEVILLTTSIGFCNYLIGREISTISEEPNGINYKYSDLIEGKLDKSNDDCMNRGYSNDEYVNRFIEYAELPWTAGPLEKQSKHLILLAVEAIPSRFNRKAAQIHAQNAIDYGAEVEEVMAVFETASIIGVHSMNNVSVLIEEAARRGKLPSILTEHPEFVHFRNPRYY